MPKGQAMLGPVEFVSGWVKGVKEGKTVTEIADTLGMKYGACLARVRSLQNKGVALPDAKKAPKGKQLTPSLLEQIQAALDELDRQDGIIEQSLEKGTI